LRLSNITALAHIRDLLPHEQVDEGIVELMMKIIEREGMFRVPILIEGKYGVILDGHHRVEALRRMGIELVPVYAVDYSSDDILVFPRRKEIPVSKSEVLRRALSGNLFPHKTTKHVLRRRTVPCTMIFLEELREGKLPLPVIAFDKRDSSTAV